jgi:hypothetical protein
LRDFQLVLKLEYNPEFNNKVTSNTHDQAVNFTTFAQMMEFLQHKYVDTAGGDRIIVGQYFFPNGNFPTCSEDSVAIL